MSHRCSETVVDLFESAAYMNADGFAVLYDDGRKKWFMTYGQLVKAIQHVCVNLGRVL